MGSPAQEKLTLTCARRRMVRGETQYNKMSRFLKEIPLELLSTGAVFHKEDQEEGSRKMAKSHSAYQQARQAFHTKHLQGCSRGNNSAAPPEAWIIRWETGCAM